MHFPVDNTDDPVLGHGSPRRVVYQQFSGEVLGGDDPGLPAVPPIADPLPRALHAKLTWEEGGAPVSISRQETEEMIELVEQVREATIRQVEEVLPAQIAEQQRLVDAHDATLAEAERRVHQLLLDEQRAWDEANRGWQPSPTGVIITHEMVVEPTAWLESRQTRLADTPEYRHLGQLRARRVNAAADEGRAVRELQRLRDELNEARRRTLPLIDSRLYELRQHLERESAPPPPPLRPSPELRAHLLELQKTGRLFGQLNLPTE